MIKTFSPKASQVTRGWQVLDASGQTLGRLATQAAIYLRGKHKPTFTPHMDMGDHVVIVNAERIRVTGNKLQQKVYYRHSGYPGGQKSRTLEQELAKFPSRVVERAVRGMLPRNALGEAMYRKLHVYAGPEHPHRGQLVTGEAPVRVAPSSAPEQPEGCAGRAGRAKPEKRAATETSQAAAIGEQQESAPVAEGAESHEEGPAPSDEEETRA